MQKQKTGDRHRLRCSYNLETTFLRIFELTERPQGANLYEYHLPLRGGEYLEMKILIFGAPGD